MKSKTDSEGFPDSNLQIILEKELPKKLPATVRKAILTVVSVLGYSWSAPLPPPAMMEHYERNLPGISDRIMKMTEEEQQIRKRDNKHILWNDTWRVWGSVIVSLALIVLAGFVILKGYQIPGILFGLSGLIAIVVRELFRKKKEAK